MCEQHWKRTLIYLKSVVCQLWKPSTNTACNTCSMLGTKMAVSRYMLQKPFVRQALINVIDKNVLIYYIISMCI